MVKFYLLSCLLIGYADRATPDPPVVATFSIVAYDPETKELGIAVQSRFLAVGAVVPWAKAGVGAIATQSYANTTYGPRGLEMLAQGQAPDDVMKALIESDALASRRQVGIVDAHGKAATFTGDGCMAWCGGVKGEHYCCQGNILAGEDVVKAMERSFVESRGDLGERLIAALQAGQDAGGDRRGMQSAALLIVREGWGYAGMNDRYRDVRVDDHPEPIKELKRIYDLHRRAFPRPRP
jgi:uncharacterized Ntn-hydrolase superfamily protein